jgi:hypothetical protein
MNTIFNQARPYIQHLSLSENNVFIAGLKKHAKVTAIALAIISAIAASFYIFQWLQNSMRPTPPTPPVPIDKPPASPVINVHPSSPRKPVVPPKPPVRGQTKPFVFNHTPRPTTPPIIEPFFSTPASTPQPSQNSHRDISKPLNKKFEKPSVNQKTDLASPIQSPVSQIVTSPATPPPQSLASSLPFTEIEGLCTEVLNNIFSDRTFSTQKAFAAIDPKARQQIIDIYNELVYEFERRNPRLQKIKLGDPVPAYFANVKEQTNEQRKYLSLVGIRSMFRYGPEIVDDLGAKLFIGGEHHYEDNKGLKAFKTYTGNMVDLDTELDSKKFTNDAQAIKKARELIVSFGEMCGLKSKKGKQLTPEDVADQLPKRKLDLPTDLVYSSLHNTDRSNHGIWKRIPPGKFNEFYYVNVPNCDVAILATLRLPYMIAEIAQLAKENNGGTLPKDFLDDFFTNGVSDKCFNEKVTTFMDFYIAWKAKFDRTPTPEEEAKRNIENGTFGEELQRIGVDKALANKYDRNKLVGLLFNHYSTLDDPLKGLSKDQWIEEEKDTCMALLLGANIWESVLYQSEPDREYFLLNLSTLKSMMGDLYFFIESF